MANLLCFLSEHDPNFRKARLPALFADFRPQRTLNPDGYRANVAAWQDALYHLAFKGLLSHNGLSSSTLVIGVDETLIRAFESKTFGQPLALGTAIRDAISMHKLIPVNQFLLPNPPKLGLWLSSLPRVATEWTLRQLGINSMMDSVDRVPIGRYVIVSNIEKIGQAFEQYMTGKSSRYERVFTKSQFQAVATSCLATAQSLTDEDIEVLLIYLHRDKKLIDYNGDIVCVRDRSDQSLISEDDVAIASIKELTSNLKHQIDLLNKRIASLQQETKAALQRKNRAAAMAALKSTKLAEASLTKRYTTLGQLEQVAAKIEQAFDQVQIFSVMQSSATALKHLNSQVGNSDRVEEVMDQIREQMAATDEVAAILAEGPGDPIDESELNASIEALEQETRATAKEKTELERQQITSPAADVQKTQLALAGLPEPPSGFSDYFQESSSPPIEARVAELSLNHN